MSYFLDSASDAEEVPGQPVLVWHRAKPGPRLARWLEELVNAGIEELSDFDVVELVAAAERIASWAHHLARDAAAELSQRESMQPEVPTALALDLTPERVTGAELAMRLGHTPRSAQQLVRDGRSFQGALAATGEALRTGRIDAEKARVVVDGLEGVPGQIAVGVQWPSCRAHRSAPAASSPTTCALRSSSSTRPRQPTGASKPPNAVA